MPTTKPQDALMQLLALSVQLPDGLQSDWKDSNHYELTCEDCEHFWLELAELFRYYDGEDEDWCQQKHGKRIGLMMDIVAKLKEAEPMLRRLCEIEREARDAD